MRIFLIILTFTILTSCSTTKKDHVYECTGLQHGALIINVQTGETYALSPEGWTNIGKPEELVPEFGDHYSLDELNEKANKQGR
jgi:hypothetical protein